MRERQLKIVQSPVDMRCGLGEGGYRTQKHTANIKQDGVVGYVIKSIFGFSHIPFTIACVSFTLSVCYVLCDLRCAKIKIEKKKIKNLSTRVG